MSPMPRTKTEIRTLMEGLEERGLWTPLRTIARAYNVTMEDVLSRNRSKRIIQARDACIAHLYDKHQMSSPEIGKLMGMDHTSALVARDRHYDRDNAAVLKAGK